MSENIQDELNTEYYRIDEKVNEFDKKLLTVKGWGVTLSLVALTLGFQTQHYGIFLVASISSLAFWAIEGYMKRHQMQFYVRMREIEVIKSELSKLELPDGTKVSSPQINWNWINAGKYFRGKLQGALPSPIRYEQSRSFVLVWLFPVVALPHVVTFVVGSILFMLGILGLLNMPL